MLKQLASCVREYKRDSILTPIYVTLEVVMEVVIPLIMANLIDLGIDAGDVYKRQRYTFFSLICRTVRPELHDVIAPAAELETNLLQHFHRLESLRPTNSTMAG